MLHVCKCPHPWASSNPVKGLQSGHLMKLQRRLHFSFHPNHSVPHHLTTACDANTTLSHCEMKWPTYVIGSMMQSRLVIMLSLNLNLWEWTHQPPSANTILSLTGDIFLELFVFGGGSRVRRSFLRVERVVISTGNPRVSSWWPIPIPHQNPYPPWGSG